LRARKSSFLALPHIIKNFAMGSAYESKQSSGGGDSAYSGSGMNLPNIHKDKEYMAKLMENP
jgi:hypothetical protein